VESHAARAYAQGMVAVLIVIGVIAFLVFDAYVIARVMKGRASTDDYGSFAVPGETTITVPAGKLRLSYQESYKASSTGDSIDFDVPGALQVEVTSAAGGEPLPIKGPGFRGMGSSVDTGSGWSRALIGKVEIAAPGTYKITAGPELEGSVEPQVLVGK
jgi:hypothetical protein